MNYQLIFNIFILLYVFLLGYIILVLRKRLKDFKYSGFILDQRIELNRVRSVNNYDFIKKLSSSIGDLLDMAKENNNYIKLNDKHLKLLQESIDITHNELMSLEKEVVYYKHEPTLKKIN